MTQEVIMVPLFIPNNRNVYQKDTFIMLSSPIFLKILTCG
jgi:hypothetical protein